MTLHYQQLFAAFREAGSALESLRERASDTSDASLARDPDYHRLHHCGMVIATLGGGNSIAAAIEALSDDPRNSVDLRRYWAGMDQWPQSPSQYN